MSNFLLYLIESGMCLTLLYLDYVFFFRKETYFNFNRFYLIIILIASSIIPIIHVNVAVSEKDNIEKTFQDIGKFRSYYTEFIGFADSEFGRSRYRKYEIATFEENSFHPQKTADFDDNLVSDKGINQSVLSATNVANFDFNIIKAIIAIYLFGVGWRGAPIPRPPCAPRSSSSSPTRGPRTRTTGRRSSPSAGGARGRTPTTTPVTSAGGGAPNLTKHRPFTRCQGKGPYDERRDQVEDVRRDDRQEPPDAAARSAADDGVGARLRERRRPGQLLRRETVSARFVLPCGR
jgi:hypothetical protein